MLVAFPGLYERSPAAAILHAGSAKCFAFGASGTIPRGLMWDKDIVRALRRRCKFVQIIRTRLIGVSWLGGLLAESRSGEFLEGRGCLESSPAHRSLIGTCTFGSLPPRSLKGKLGKLPVGERTIVGTTARE